jgi:hypothetical protein
MGRRKRHTPDEVIARLRDADRLLSDGKSVGQPCQQHGGAQGAFGGVAGGRRGFALEVAP